MHTTPLTERSMGRIGAKRWQHYSQLFSEQMEDVLPLIRPFGRYVASHIALAKPMVEEINTARVKSVSDLFTAFSIVNIEEHTVIREFEEQEGFCLADFVDGEDAGEMEGEDSDGESTLCLPQSPRKRKLSDR